MPGPIVAGAGALSSYYLKKYVKNLLKEQNL